MRALLARIARLTGLAGTRCPVCSALTSGGESPLCPACALALRPRTQGCCALCGDMFGDGHGHGGRNEQGGGNQTERAEPAIICGECRLDPPPWDRLYFHGAYSGPLRDMIIDYKFHGGLHRTRLLISLAVQAYQPAEIPLSAVRHGPGVAGSPDLVLPVPLHPRRLLWRGYNQSTELARGLGRALQCPVPPDALVRTRNTVPQLSLDMRQRRENIRDAFAADPAQVAGRSILLVDDVYTTGATLTECARTLRRAGASGVAVLVLARARREPD